MAQAPEHITIIPDDFRMEHVGTLVDGGLFYCETQIFYDGRSSIIYYAAYTFEADGTLRHPNIERLGARGSYTQDEAAELGDRLLEQLGPRTTATIKVRPFEVEFDSLLFGLVPRAIGADGEEIALEDADDDDVRVEAMPGNTISWYAPWDEGGYDT